MKGLVDKYRKNSIEPSYFDFYNLFLKYRTEPNSLNFDDVLALEEIASRCPGVDGPAVFQARALLQAITGQVFSFSSDCNSQMGARQMQQNPYTFEKSTELIEQEPTLKIYPNPASNEITVEIANDWKFKEVQIFDVTNRLCYQFSLSQLVSKQHLNIDLKNGMYFAKIIGLEKEKSVKFCVEK